MQVHRYMFMTLRFVIFFFVFKQDNLYCVGFQNGGLQSKDGKGMVLLGDLVLSNKLVVYDLEN
jgi:hypothetical protein